MFGCFCVFVTDVTNVCHRERVTLQMSCGVERVKILVLRINH